MYDSWKRTYLDKEMYEGFSILTLSAAGIFSACSFTRQPLILSLKDSRKWLKTDAALMEITKLLDYYPDKKINGYSINSELIEKKLNDKSIIKPLGPFLRDNEKFDIHGVVNQIKASRFKKGATHEKID